MPDFILDTGSPETHAWFDGLHPFTQGAFEAALFTAPAVHLDDGETVEILDGGLDHLTPAARALIEAESVRFYLDHLDAIREAVAHGGDSGDYDHTQAGRDFWFTGTGCGIGYGDRGLGVAGEKLESAARYRCEDLLFAEPGPGADLAALKGSDTSAAVIDSCCSPAPLTDAERARLAAVRGFAPVAPLAPVSGRYGAPSGRSGDNLAGLRAVVVPVTLDAGGYDAGGAYWGHGETLWRAVAYQAIREAHTRAPTLADACRLFRGMFPGLQIEGADR